MRRELDWILCMLGLSALTGCANLNAVKKDFILTDGTAVSIDAKQRALFSVRNWDSDTKVYRNVVCAEPSPDSLSALAANLGVDVTVAAKSLGLAYGSQESAASIGLRTQTIQTLRDAMFRLCEGYAGGALDDIGFVRLQRRYQAVMLGLLAIEQLTGATVANQATLGGNGAAKVGNSFGQASALITDTRQKQIVAQATAAQKVEAVEAKKKEVTAAEVALKKATEDAAGQETQALKDAKAAQSARSTELATAEEELTKAKQVATVITADLTSLELLRKEMDRASAVTSASAQLTGATHAAAGPTDTEGAKYIAKAVENIVIAIVSHDYSKEACMDWLLSKSMRDSFASGAERDFSLVKLQLNMCLEERKLTQEFQLAKMRWEMELAATTARPASTVAVAGKAGVAGAVPDVRINSTPPRTAAKAGEKAKSPENPPAAAVVATPAPAAAAASKPSLDMPRTMFEPASAATGLNKIIDDAQKQKSLSRTPPEK